MKKVLIIEDEENIRSLYTKCFSKANYQVDEAEDGEVALQKARENAYDIILLDILLPKVMGIDVLKILRKPGILSKDTPIFLITNLGQESIIKEAFKLGADGYLLKAQLTPDEVVSEINNYFKELNKMKNKI